MKWDYDQEFFVPNEVTEYIEELQEKFETEENKWKKLFEEYKKVYPKEASELEADICGDADVNIEIENSEKATRASSGDALNYVKDLLPNLFGGSADLGPSNKSVMKGEEYFSKNNPLGRNFHFGVREHAMAAICNGIALHGGLIPYCATFLIFSDYLKPAARLSALMGLRVIYILTHDSIGVGEDGPTHQPIEQLLMLRSIPNMTVFRPADCLETAASWEAALSNKKGPTAICLTRQKLKPVNSNKENAKRGAYPVIDEKDPDIILLATGSEVNLCVEAAKELKGKYKIKVVSMPSREVFEKQDKSYREEVLPSSVTKRLVVEAASPIGWEGYMKEGKILAMRSFGASAKASDLMLKFGFTKENVIKLVEEILR